MCSRGVYQLKKLSLFFCDWGGSSNGVRNLLMSPDFEQFKKEHPHIDIQLILKRNHHPYFSGIYINGYTKDVPIRGLSKEDIVEQLENCNNSFGRKSIEATGKRVLGVKQSIQGKWYPNMWGNYPRAQMENLHIVEEPIVPMVEKPLRYPKVKGNGEDVYDEITRRKKKDRYRGP